MPDPFSNMSEAGEAFIDKAVAVLERRAAEPVMVEAVQRYLSALPRENLSRIVEVGAGSVPIARQIAMWAPHAHILATEPAAGFLSHARKLSAGIDNLTFETRDGRALELAAGSQDFVVMHALLSHVYDPGEFLAAVHRVLRAEGWLVVFDGDFAKASLENILGDPLGACREYFQHNFVTDPFVCTGLPELSTTAGFEVSDFWMIPRLNRDDDGMRPWVEFTTGLMVERDQICSELAQGLLAEYDRRREKGSLSGVQTYATLIARKPVETGNA